MSVTTCSGTFPSCWKPVVHLLQHAFGFTITPKEVAAPAFVKPTSSQTRNPCHTEHGSQGKSDLTLSSPKSRKSLLLAGTASPPSFFGQRPKEPRKQSAVPPPRLHTRTRTTSARPFSVCSLRGGAKLSFSKVRGWGMRTGEPSPCRSTLAQPCRTTPHITSRAADAR